jgi:hypothetical protein
MCLPRLISHQKAWEVILCKNFHPVLRVELWLFNFLNKKSINRIQQYPGAYFSTLHKLHGLLADCLWFAHSDFNLGSVTSSGSNVWCCTCWRKTSSDKGIRFKFQYVESMFPEICELEYDVYRLNKLKIVCNGVQYTKVFQKQFPRLCVVDPSKHFSCSWTSSIWPPSSTHANQSMATFLSCLLFCRLHFALQVQSHPDLKEEKMGWVRQSVEMSAQ